MTLLMESMDSVSSQWVPHSEQNYWIRSPLLLVASTKGEKGKITLALCGCALPYLRTAAPVAKPSRSRTRYVLVSGHRLRTSHTRMAQSFCSPLPEIGAVGMQPQKVNILNNHGEKLVRCLAEAGSKELVIMCHGFRSSKESKTLTALADALEGGGISTFRFDFSGNGESEGSFRYGHYRREADDLHAVVQYFSGIKREISAIVGHSKGGNVVLLYASMYNDIPTVVNVSGRFNLEGGIDGRLGKDFIQRIKKDGFIDVMDETGKVKYCVTEESLMDHLRTDMHAACLSIDKNCRIQNSCTFRCS